MAYNINKNVKAQIWLHLEADKARRPTQMVAHEKWPRWPQLQAKAHKILTRREETQRVKGSTWKTPLGLCWNLAAAKIKLQTLEEKVQMQDIRISPKGANNAKKWLQICKAIKETKNNKSQTSNKNSEISKAIWAKSDIVSSG